MKLYLLNILIFIDIGINVILLGGSPYETLSSRIGKRRDKGDKWACIICRMLDRLDDRHCSSSQVNDYGMTLKNWWKN